MALLMLGALPGRALQHQACQIRLAHSLGSCPSSESANAPARGSPRAFYRSGLAGQVPGHGIYSDSSKGKPSHEDEPGLGPLL